jgi:hypothetical protein
MMQHPSAWNVITPGMGVLRFSRPLIVGFCTGVL